MDSNLAEFVFFQFIFQQFFNFFFHVISRIFSLYAKKKNI